MGEIKQLIEIDWKYVFVAICLFLVCLKFVWSLLDWFLFEKLKIETGKMKQLREDRELLKETTELAKTTAENLDKLQKRHVKDEEEFRKNLNDYMEESRKDRKALHDEMTKYSKNRIDDRKQSFEIQKELTDNQKELSKSLADISVKIDSIQENTDRRFEENERKHNKRVRAELKDKIGQTYRYHHSTGKINDIELEALEDLIAEYEAADGENSFVHSLVQKEMYTWEKVERI